VVSASKSFGRSVPTASRLMRVRPCALFCSQDRSQLLQSLADGALDSVNSTVKARSSLIAAGKRTAAADRCFQSYSWHVPTPHRSVAATRNSEVQRQVRRSEAQHHAHRVGYPPYCNVVTLAAARS
jgi:hypothetical protein